MNRVSPASRWMPAWPVADTLLLGMIFTASVAGQSLVDAERIPEVRRLFETALSAPQLRCEIYPVQPAFNFAFRFETGYKADFPLAQIRGAGHGLTIHVKITPEGRPPVYLTKTGTLPDVPDTGAEAETDGTFIVGDGSYDVELLLQDDLHRSCRSAWKIQTRRAGSERQLRPASTPGAVEPIPVRGSPLPEGGSGPRIARLTILLHAAPMLMNLSKLQPDDIQKLVDSLSSLLRELPAQSVRLIAFNLDQRAVVFRKDGFEASQMSDLAAALNQMDLARVDYRTLQQSPEPLDLLLGLVQEELRNPKLPDALIVMGPRTRIQKDPPAGASGKRPAAPPIFSLQWQTARPLQAASANRRTRRGQTPAFGETNVDLPPGRGAGDGGPLDIPLTPELGLLPDAIQRLMGRLKGETISIVTPHDLADAIRHMDSRIPKTGPPRG